MFNDKLINVQQKTSTRLGIFNNKIEHKAESVILGSLQTICIFNVMYSPVSSIWKLWQK